MAEKYSQLRLVQELAMNSQDPPSRYSLSEEKYPTAASLPPSSVPVIDLSSLSKSDGEDELAQLFSAAKSWGLFLVTGHEIPFSILDEMLKVTKEFFALPVEERQRYTNMKDGKHFQYEGYGNDKVVSDEQTLDWCDRLYLVVLPEDKRDFSLWPEVPRNFRDILHEFTIKSKQIGDYILRFIAKKLELNDDFFTKLLDEKAEIFSRLTYYPHCTRPDAVYGIKPHSDGSVLTILLLDKDVGGLRVKKDNEWVDIPTVPNSLLIIFGDIMELISNGTIKSPLHYVTTNSERERISVAMFYLPEADKELQPADAFVSEEKPALYKKVKVKDYSVALFDLFTRGGRPIDLFKVE
jgi:isopenicillin N synthase-like dioxygenase